MELEYGPFKGRPTTGIRFVIKKNKDMLFNLILEDLNTWCLNLQLRLKILTQLYHYILCCEDGILPHMKQIFKVLFKYADDDSKEVRDIIYKIAYSMGIFIPADILFPYYLETLFARESSGGPIAGEGALKQSLRISLKLLNEIIRATDKNELQPHIKSLISILGSHEFDYGSSPEILSQATELLIMADLIMEHSPKSCSEYRSQLFNAILNITATTGDLQKYIDKLSKFSELKSTQELYLLELPNLISNMLKEAPSWSKFSGRRFAFKNVILNADSAIEIHWEKIIEIIEICTNQIKDYELRYDMLDFLEKIIEIHTSKKSTELLHYSELILIKILIPCCVWKVGKQNSNIRKTSVQIIRKLIERNYFSKENLYKYYKDLMSVLKSCLEDEWNAELRLVSVSFIGVLMNFLNGVITGIL